MRGLFKSVTLAFCMLCFFGTVAEARIKFKHYLRFEHEGTISYGELRAGWVYELSAAPFLGGEPTGEQYSPTSVKILTPVVPGQVFAVTQNYQGNVENLELISKSPASIIGPGDVIPKPAGSASLIYKGEMVIVIGKQAKDIDAEGALEYVFGVTAGNNISDDFSPVGPVIVNGIKFDKLHLETWVNGDVLQAESTKNMIFDVATIVSYASQKFTLEPGDIIFTGTPGSTGNLEVGDKVIITLEGVGGLTNTIDASN